jgi:hypothetical protein
MSRNTIGSDIVKCFLSVDVNTIIVKPRTATGFTVFEGVLHQSEGSELWRCADYSIDLLWNRLIGLQLTNPKANQSLQLDFKENSDRTLWCLPAMHVLRLFWSGLRLRADSEAGRLEFLSLIGQLPLPPSPMDVSISPGTSVMTMAITQ